MTIKSFGKSLVALDDESLGFDPQEVGFSLTPDEKTQEQLRDLDLSAVEAEKSLKKFSLR
jgi:hypothetical protein